MPLFLLPNMLLYSQSHETCSLGYGNASDIVQVLHHFLTPLYGWVICRFYPGGNATFGAALNFFVHTIMYSYYLLASMGPRYAGYLWWKRYLTTFQVLLSNKQQHK